MNTLAFDTCFGACSVAVTWEGVCPGGSYRFEALERGHAERLLPMLEDAMSAAPFALKDIERLVVTTGPGTFTGQRVGIAAARALTLACGAQVGVISSLELMAHTAAAQLGAAIEGHALAVAVDARRGEIYFQVFEAGSRRALEAPILVTPEDAAARIAPYAAVTAVGSGADLVAGAALAQGRTVPTRLAALQPDARYAPLSAVKFGFHPPRPLYLRPPDAKPQDGKHLARAT